MAKDTQKLILELKAKGVTLTKAQLKQLDTATKATGASMVAMGAAVAAATVAIVALGKAFTSIVRTGKEFEQSMANLKAISGATNTEMLKLEKTARQLGASTKYTASEVGGLQTEFAKLGFTAKEIDNATGATLALASAVGADLSEAAEVAGQTVRGFGLNANQTARVTDVMALSFSRSALDMRKFTDSMKYVAPIAKMAGFSIEETTAVLGVLANAGIDGSLAGTALRTVFLELSNESSALQEALGGGVDTMEELVEGLIGLQSSGIGTEDMLKLVNKRAVSAFSILLDGTDTLTDLSKAFDSAGGSAQRMADIQLDTLEGKLTILNSAWQGFSIAVYDYFEEPLKNATDGLTEFLQAMTGAMEVPLSDQLQEQQQEFINLTDVLQDVNASETTREKIIEKLKSAYPEYLDNLDLEKASLEDIAVMQEKATESMRDRIVEARFAEQLADIRAEKQNKINLLYNIESGLLGEAVNPALEKYNMEIEKGNQNYTDWVTAVEKSIKSLEDQETALLNEEQVFKDWFENRKEAAKELGEMEFVPGIDELDAGDGYSVDPTYGPPTDTEFDPAVDDREIEKIEEIIVKESTLAERRAEYAKQAEESSIRKAEALAFEAEMAEKVMVMNEQGIEVAHQFTEAEIASIAEKMDAGTSYITAIQEALEESGLTDGVRIFTEESNEEEFEAMQAQLEMIEDFVGSASDALNSYASQKMASTKKAHQESMKLIDQEEKKELDTLKKTEAYQRATAEAKIQMEENVTKKFNERREEETAASNAELRKQFEMQKAAKYATTIMSVATAVMKAFETAPHKAGLPGSAMAIATGAIQLATINAEQPPSMAEGGLIGGQLHGGGGTPIIAERDEFIMNRQAVEDVGADRLENINEGGGAGGLQIFVEGNVMSDDFVEDTLMEKIKDAIRREGPLA